MVIEATKEAVSAAAEASSAHSRINIPLNLDNWRALSEQISCRLMWFHQHILDTRMTYTDAKEALGYDQSTVFRVLKGTYAGNYDNVCKAIDSYRKIVERRGTIQVNEYVENSIAKMIFAGLDYALANNSITMIIGESRMGKTVATDMWRTANNHGTSVYVVAPPYGGTKMLLRRISTAVGVNKNLNVTDMYDGVSRSFNKNRILIIDEAHRLLPGDRRSNAANMEVLRDLHDTTGCALAMIATARFDDTLRSSQYMYEQILGRIGMPIKLHTKISRNDWMPIMRQYVAKPSDRLCAECDRIANTCGRLGILAETLKVASRMANKSKQLLAEEHVFKAIALRKQMSGQNKQA